MAPAKVEITLTVPELLTSIDALEALETKDELDAKLKADTLAKLNNAITIFKTESGFYDRGGKDFKPKDK